MNRVVTQLVTLVALALFAATPVHALDGDTIDRWISAMHEFNAWADEQPEDLGPDDHDGLDDPADMQAMMGEIQHSMAEAARMNEEVKAIAQRHGFDSPQAWSQVSGRIFRAFYAVEMERALPEMEREMAEGIREMEANPDMPEEQKAAMRDMMEQQLEIMKEAVPDVPEQDREAVISRADELRAVFED